MAQGEGRLTNVLLGLGLMWESRGRLWQLGRRLGWVPLDSVRAGMVPALSRAACSGCTTVLGTQMELSEYLLNEYYLPAIPIHRPDLERLNIGELVVFPVPFIQPSTGLGELPRN